MNTMNDTTDSEGVEMDHNDDRTATVISIEKGDGTPVYAGELRKTLDELKDEIDRLIENSYEIVEGGSGFYEISLHPEFEGSNILGDIVLQLDGGTATIKPGKVAIVNKTYFSEKGESLKSGMLLLPGEDSITALDGVDAVPVTIHFGDDKGDEEGHYLALMSQESGEFATILSVLEALYVLSSIKYIYDKIGLVVDDSNRPMIIRTGKLFTEAMRGKPRKNEVWTSGTDFTIEMGKLAISSDDEIALDTAIGGNKTLIQLNALATASGYKFEPDKPCRIETTLDELIEQRGGDVKNRKTRAKITKELKAISSIAWNFENYKGEFVRIPLAGGMCSVRHGNVSFAFSAEYMGAVIDRAAGRLPLDRALLSTDEKNNPNATPIGFKLCTHTYQNKGKKNENTLSVSRLLDFVNGIPSYEEVSKGNRNYTDRIIKPLERDLNHLVDKGFIEYWDYCHENGEPLEDSEQDQRIDFNGEDCALPYDVAIKCNIQWRLTEEYAEQMAETMESREKKRIEAEAAKQRNEERNKRIERKKETYIAKAAAKEGAQNS